MRPQPPTTFLIHQTQLDSVVGRPRKQAPDRQHNSQPQTSLVNPSRREAPRLVQSKRLVYFVRFFLFGACVNEEAATDFCDSVDFGLLRIFDAFDATDFEVRSLRLATIRSLAPQELPDNVCLSNSTPIAFDDRRIAV
jgi:hypothetical protein